MEVNVYRPARMHICSQVFGQSCAYVPFFGPVSDSPVRRYTVYLGTVLRCCRIGCGGLAHFFFQRNLRAWRSSAPKK